MPAISYDDAHGYPPGYYPPPETKAVEPDQALLRAMESGRRAQALGFGYDNPVQGNVCRQCQFANAPGHGTKGGRCPHRPTRAELIQQRAWLRTAEQTVLLQQAQRNQGKSAALVVDWHREINVRHLRSELLALLETM